MRCEHEVEMFSQWIAGKVISHASKNLI